VRGYKLIMVCYPNNLSFCFLQALNLLYQILFIYFLLVVYHYYCGVTVLLFNNEPCQGQTVTPYELEKGMMYPLVYAGDVEVADTPSHLSGCNLSFYEHVNKY